MSIIAKFNASKNNIGDEKLKKIAFVIDDLMTKYLHSQVDEKTIKQLFGEAGVYQTVCEERKNDSMQLLNNKISALLFAKTMEDYDPKQKVVFNEDTYMPDENTAKLMKKRTTWEDPVWRSKFAVNYETVISPAVQTLEIGFYNQWVQVHNIGWGDSPLITVEGNEVFVVTEVAQDSFKAANQTLKSKGYTAVPRPQGAKTTVNFYDLASGKVNWAKHIMAIAQAFVRKWNQMAIEGLVGVINDATNNGVTNTQYFKITLNDANFNALVKALTAANDNGNINVYGDLDAVTQILPNTTVPTMDAALSTLLGKEWTSKGYIGEYHGANVYKINQALLPGTINAAGIAPNGTPYFAAPENILWFTNENDKPMHLVFEGETLSVARDKFETGDGTLTFLVVSNFDMIYVPSTKIGGLFI